MKVRLTQKYADQIDGIDLSAHRVGDVIDLPPREADLIIAENWAHPDRRVLAMASDALRRAEDRDERRSRHRGEEHRGLAADRSRRARR